MAFSPRSDALAIAYEDRTILIPSGTQYSEITAVGEQDVTTLTFNDTARLLQVRACSRVSRPSPSSACWAAAPAARRRTGPAASDRTAAPGLHPLAAQRQPRCR